MTSFRGRAWTSARTITRGEIPLVITMRVKNEEQYLGRCLDSLQPLACPIVLLDDNSTDKTEEIARSFHRVNYIGSRGAGIDEARDRQALIEVAVNYQPEWVLTIDGDEVLPHQTCDRIREFTFMELPNVNVLRLAIAFMWGEDHYVDLPQPFYHHRMWRATDVQPPARLNPLRMTGAPDFEYGLHCGPLPRLKGAYTHKDIPAFIKAYGYQTPEEYERHFRFYTEHDEELWTHNDIVGRLNNPLARWHDDMVPRFKTRDELLARYSTQMKEGIARWEAQIEQGESKATQKPKVRKRSVGQKRKPKSRPKSERSEARS